MATDGFTETCNKDDEFFGRQRLIDCVNRHRSDPESRLIQQLKDEVQIFAEGTYQQDDLTIVVVKVQR